MVDLTPNDTRPRFAPRDTNLVDAIAEVKRIADQSMRSNPMTDARIDSGLTLWRGNYGGDLVWIGEIEPEDQNQFDQYGNRKDQRGFVLQRDDPGQQFAILMYDSSPEVGQPLRQTLTIGDGSGHAIMQEAFNQKGRRFPDKAMPMYPKFSQNLTGAVDAVVWSGSANLIGTHINFDVEWGADATLQVSSYLRFNGGGVTVTTGTTVATAGFAYSGTVDISTIWAASDFVNIEWHVWKSGGGGVNYSPRVNRMRNFTDG